MSMARGLAGHGHGLRAGMPARSASVHQIRPSAAPKPSIRRALSVSCQQPAGEPGSSQPAPQRALRGSRPSIPVAGFSLASALPLLPLLGSGAGGGGAGGAGGDGLGGGGGGGQPGPEPQHLFDIADLDVEDESEEAEEGAKAPEDESWRKLLTEEPEQLPADGRRVNTRRCAGVVLVNWPEGSSKYLPSGSDLKALLNVQEGHIFNDQDLEADQANLQKQFADYVGNVKVAADYVDNTTNRQKVTYTFQPFVFPAISRLEIRDAELMPEDVKRSICEACMPKEPSHMGIGVVERLREKIEKWYQSKGLTYCYVGGFDGMDTGVLRMRVKEPRIERVAVKYQKVLDELDSEGNEVVVSGEEGEVVPSRRVLQAAAFRQGQPYQEEDAQAAINNVYGCGLLKSVDVTVEQLPPTYDKLQVNVNVQEVPKRSASMSLDWAFQLREGVPRITRQSIIPGGSVEVGHMNLFGDGQALTASLSSSDWRNPAADLTVEASYLEPFYAPNTTRNAKLFTTRKASPVFMPGPDDQGQPPLMVDRFGLKGWTSYKTGAGSNLDSAVILQRVRTVSTEGELVPQATRPNREGGVPTSVSDTGSDLSLSTQHYLARHNVAYVNGAQLGWRATLQVDQGLNLFPGLDIPLPFGKGASLHLPGLTGGLYNRVVASYTRFMPLPGVPRLTQEQVSQEKKAPCTLVLHARAGNILGQIGSYDYFTLGGPYSVRGYTHGELGVGRRFVEGAAEARLPLKNFKLAGRKLPDAQLYAFTELGHDLWSSGTLPANPTEFLRRPGWGASVGAGIKALGATRLEYARDMNAGRNVWQLTWGERF